jgi:hypothetical protein
MISLCFERRASAEFPSAEIPKAVAPKKEFLILQSSRDPERILRRKK